MPIRSLFPRCITAVLAVLVLLAVPGGAMASSGHKVVKARIALGAHLERNTRAAKTAKTAKTATTAKTAAAKAKAAAAKAKATAAAAKAKATAAAASAPCANTTLVPDAGNLDLVRAALVCLHNQIRAQNRLAPLTENGALGSAAVGHSVDMVSAGYFDHTAPSGATFLSRIFATHYVSADGDWLLGENLAWGSGDQSTPAGIMQAWMSSPEHRANILKGAYREIGFGIALGTPSGGAGATITADFGTRN